VTGLGTRPSPSRWIGMGALYEDHSDAIVAGLEETFQRAEVAASPPNGKAVPLR
jgi:hypothetical protein